MAFTDLEMSQNPCSSHNTLNGKNNFPMLLYIFVDLYTQVYRELGFGFDFIFLMCFFLIKGRKKSRNNETTSKNVRFDEKTDQNSQIITEEDCLFTYFDLILKITNYYFKIQFIK